eukprot:75558-Amphidinium_carterae.1
MGCMPSWTAVDCTTALSVSRLALDTSCFLMPGAAMRSCTWAFENPRANSLMRRAAPCCLRWRAPLDGLPVAPPAKQGPGGVGRGKDKCRSNPRSSADSLRQCEYVCTITATRSKSGEKEAWGSWGSKCIHL